MCAAFGNINLKCNLLRTPHFETSQGELVSTETMYYISKIEQYILICLYSNTYISKSITLLPSLFQEDTLDNGDTYKELHIYS